MSAKVEKMPPLQFFICLSIWYAAAPISFINSRLALEDVQPTIHLISLLFISAILGQFKKLFMYYYKSAAKHKQQPSGDLEYGFDKGVIKSHSLSTKKKSSYSVLMLLSVINIYGYLSTMQSTLLIPTSVSHLVRATEVCFVAVCSSMVGIYELTGFDVKIMLAVTLCFALFLGESTLSELYSVCSFDADCYQKRFYSSEDSFSLSWLLGLILVVFSNICMAWRSILLKMHNVTATTKLNYSDLCIYGPLFLIPLTLFIHVTEPLKLTNVLGFNNLVAGVFHFVYLEASFFCINFISPLHHSLAKVISKIIIVISTSIILGYEVTILKSVSIFLIIALIFYRTYYNYSMQLPLNKQNAQSKIENINPHGLNMNRLWSIKSVRNCFFLGVLCAILVSFVMPFHNMVSVDNFGLNDTRSLNEPSLNSNTSEWKRISKYATYKLTPTGKLNVFEDLKCNAHIIDDSRWKKVHFYSGTPKQLFTTEQNLDYKNRKPLIYFPDAYNFLGINEQQKFTDYNADSNLGNNVWRFGATSLVDMDRNEVRTGTFYNLEHRNTSLVPDLLFMPLANILYNESLGEPTSIIETLNKFKHIGRHRIMVGAGIQMEYTKPLFKSKTGLGVQPEMYMLQDTNEYQIDNFIKNILNKQDFVSVRGRYTKQACLRGGANVRSMGCPSLMISDDLSLGATIQHNLDNLLAKSKESKRNLKILITLPLNSNIDNYIDLFFALFVQFPRSVIVIQDSRDFNVLRHLQQKLKNEDLKLAFAAIINEWPGEDVILKRIVCFSSVTDWLGFVSDFDLSVGARIHGTMIPIAAGVPSLIIAPDYRVQEIGDALLVPTLSYLDESVHPERFINSNHNFCIEQVLHLINRLFDSKKFDQNRVALANEYVNILRSFEVHPSQNLLRIASTKIHD